MGFYYVFNFQNFKTFQIYSEFLFWFRVHMSVFFQMLMPTELNP